MSKAGRPSSMQMLRGKQLRWLQPEERPDFHAWRYRAGEITLRHALRLCMASGYPVPEAIAQAVESAFLGYEFGLHADLAEPFGVVAPLSTRKGNAKIHAGPGDVRGIVDLYHARGFPLSHPGTASGTAFHLAATDLHLSPLTVHRTYYRKP